MMQLLKASFYRATTRSLSLLSPKVRSPTRKLSMMWSKARVYQCFNCYSVCMQLWRLLLGKGMIMLLSGPPGVGKTLTAESGKSSSSYPLTLLGWLPLVAENMHAPLYMMSAGDLGLESSEVESSLSNVLEMTSKWNAVLLLDEADVFLEQRSAHDLERNKLVSSKCLITNISQCILTIPQSSYVCSNTTKGFCFSPQTA